MRIGQLVASYQQQFEFQVQTRSQTQTRASGSHASAKTTRAPVAEPTPGIDQAKRANMARLTDAGKGFMRAVAVRDGVAAVTQAVGGARELIQQAADPTADRAELQKLFGKALSDLDLGAKNQATALSDSTLGSTTFDPARVKVLSADQLGKQASATYTSVADLKKLDLTNASTEQLAQAAAVLDAAKTQGTARLAAADAQAQRIGGTVYRFQAVNDLFAGNASKRQGYGNVSATGGLFNAFG